MAQRLHCRENGNRGLSHSGIGDEGLPTAVIEKSIMVAVHDGVRLASDVYRTDGAESAPVSAARTPCDKERRRLL